MENAYTEYDKHVMTTTITGRMMKCIEELVQSQVDLLLNEENEWFIELLDTRIDERLQAR